MEEPNDNKKPKVVPIPWLLANILVAVATFAVTWLYYDHIPNRIPNHFDLEGNVTDWSDKHSAMLWFLPFTQLGLTVFMIWINWIVVYSTTSMTSDPKRKPFNNMVARRTRDFIWILNLTIVLCMFFSQSVSISLLDTTWNKFIFTGLFVAFALETVWLIWVMSRDSKRLKSKHKEDIDWEEEKHWILGGQFYFNPDDPKLMVEKRYGVGVTFNMAKWQSWALLCLFTLPGIVPIVILLWI